MLSVGQNHEKIGYILYKRANADVKIDWVNDGILSEVATMIVLGVSNPVTIWRLWRRHRRKTLLRQTNHASAIVEMSHHTVTILDNSTRNKQSAQANNTKNKDDRGASQT